MEIRRTPNFSIMVAKLAWIVFVSLVALISFRSLLIWLQIPSGELKYWGAGLVYVWLNAAVLTLGWHVYWSATEVKARLQRRKAKIKPEHGFDFEQNMATILRVQHRGLVMAISAHIISAMVIYGFLGYVSENIDLRIILTLTSVALAGVKPLYLFSQSTIQMVFEIDEESRHPEKTVYELWQKVDSLLDLEERIGHFFDEKSKEMEKQIEEQKTDFTSQQKSLQKDWSLKATKLENLWTEQMEQLKLSLISCQREVQSYKIQFSRLHNDIVDKLASFNSEDVRIMEAIRTINQNPDIQTFISRRDPGDLLEMLKALSKHVDDKINSGK